MARSLLCLPGFGQASEHKENNEMPGYDKKANAKISKVMHEKKAGTLRSGGSGKKVTSRKQAVAIALSEARRAGGRVPKKGSSTRSRKGRKK